jgi:carbamoyltransferase
MWIAAINHGHDASVCLLKDGEIILFLEEERILNQKHARYGYCVRELLARYTDELDVLLYTNSSYKKYNNFDFKNFTNVTKNTKVIEIKEHHLIHAATAFYNSGFNEAVNVVVDARGLHTSHRQETESVYYSNSDNNFKTIYKNTKEVITYSPIARTYSTCVRAAGFGKFMDDGKFMGLTSYSNKTLPFKNINTDILPNIPSYKENFDVSAIYANTVQEYLQNQVLKLIKYGIEKSGCKNVTISGGFGLNCRANYFYRKNLPADIKLYCDPICYDAGLSFGLAMYYYNKINTIKKINKLKSLYLGLHSDKNYDLAKIRDKSINLINDRILWEKQNGKL